MKATSIKILATSLALTLLASCTGGPEGQIKAALDKEMGPAKIEAKAKTDIDKLFGPKDSKFKSSVYEYVTSKTIVSYSDIKVTENKATVKVLVSKPKDDDVGGLILLAGFVDQKKLADMTMNDLMVEATKGSRKTASIDDIRQEKYEFTLDLEKKEDWVLADPKQLKQAFNKKNLIK